MGTIDKINELNNRRVLISQGGGEGQIDKVHSEDKLTARERIDQLLDSNSFVEVGMFVKSRATDFNMMEKDAPADGVVTGYGSIEGRLVYVYSQDVTVLNGSMGEMNAKKIVNIYDLAMKMGAPVIALMDSKGLRLQEATDALNGYGQIFLKQTIASGVIPQIAVVLGDCAGGATFVPGLSDFTFMVKKNSRLFLNSPNALDEKTATFDNIASASVRAEKTGVANFVFDSEEECIGKVRELVDILPANNMDDAPLYEANDDLNRVSSELNSIIPDDVKEGFDVKQIITAIADGNKFVEVSSEFAKNVVTGFVKLNGATVGIFANQSIVDEGLIDIEACEKGSKFIHFCDSFNIPILSITDVAGFKATVCQEKCGLSNYASKLVYAFANATVPKVNIVVRKALGSAYVLMNSKHIGADIVYAWPTAQISVMNSESAVKIMYSEEINNIDIEDKVAEYESMQASVYAAASRGYIDDIIEPSATRKRVIAALEMLFSKKEIRPTKKHGSVL